MNPFRLTRASDSVPVVQAATIVKLFAIGAIVSAFGTIIGVVSLAIFAPTNVAASVQVLGVGGPLVLGMMAAAQQAQAVVTDGRLTQLIQATAEKEHAKGMIAGLQENPGVNITAPEEGTKP